MSANIKGNSRLNGRVSAEFDNPVFNSDDESIGGKFAHPRNRASFQNAIANNNIRSPSGETKLEDEAVEEEVYQQAPLWDQFSETQPDEFKPGQSTDWLKPRIVCKVILIIFLFILVIFTGALQKLTLTFITTNLSPEVMCGCNSTVCSCAVLNATSNQTFPGEIRNTTPTIPSSTTTPNASTTNSGGLCNAIDNTTVASTNTFTEHLTWQYSKARAIWWTWALILVICFPYATTFLKNIWRTIGFTRPSWCGWSVLLFVLTTETCHSLGVVIMVTQVLPKLDMIHALGVFLGLGVIPSLFRVFEKENSWYPVKLVFSIVCALIQIAGTFGLPLLRKLLLELKNPTDIQDIALQAAGLVLISIHWWPNFFTSDTVTCNPLGQLVLGRPSRLNSPLKGGKLIKGTPSFKKRIKQSNTLLQMIVAGWKLIITFFGILVSVQMNYESKLSFSDFFYPALRIDDRFTECLPGLRHQTPLVDGYVDVLPLGVAVLSIFLSVCTYYVCLHALKSRIILFAYALPLIVTTPLTMLFILLIHVVDHIHSYAFAVSSGVTSAVLNLMDERIFPHELMSMAQQEVYYFLGFWLAALLLFASQVYIGKHIWTKPNNKIEPTEKLFLLPMYDGECLEQSLIYNRCRTKQVKKAASSNSTRNSAPEFVLPRPRAGTEVDMSEDFKNFIPGVHHPRLTQIYFCATMWHESPEEMLLMLKSVLRMDSDNHKKRNYQVFTGKMSSDYYNFETHVFFDDAFEPYVNFGGKHKVNKYVKQLVEIVPEAVSKYYAALGINMQIGQPVKRPTPYGGRLEWTLPGQSILVAHLKDKMKIRHKKRWSQVMYMYYFLGKKLMDHPDWTLKEKDLASQNTYLLALDGDVDFYPEAVLLLVDMMKKNLDVGAACGRIHPMGGGPLIWYQKFEYAIAHWLQKATEHIIGCVLCSPGCFSLFRAQAVMHDNVMRRYATKSTEARHYLQYDQDLLSNGRWYGIVIEMPLHSRFDLLGTLLDLLEQRTKARLELLGGSPKLTIASEDRWLCTLMIQAGYKVEYNAASDARTFAPENFDEFFNQRRRWGPSTMANILDLIMDVKNVIKTNEYMSLLYVVYQTIQFCVSIIGPGTIFMMVTAALTLVFTTLPILSAFILHASLITVYIVACFFVKEKLQLKMARILAVMYALLMCLVLISIALSIVKNPCSADAIFFYAVFGSFVLSALFHPQEISNVLHVFTYYILIPCMYMLLIIYSFANINNVSWGTREVKPTLTEQQVEEAKEAQAAAKSGKRQSIVDRLKSLWTGSGGGGDGKVSMVDENDSKRINCGSAFSCICCPTSKKETKLTEYQHLMHKMDKMESMVYDALLEKRNGVSRHRNQSFDDPPSEDDDEVITVLPGITVKHDDLKAPPPPKKMSTSARRGVNFNKEVEDIPCSRDDLVNPFWVEDEDTGEGEIIPTDDDENEFWMKFIEKYLKPLENNKEQQEAAVLSHTLHFITNSLYQTKEEVQKQLLELRVKVNFGFILANAMFAVITFTLQLREDDFSFPWPCTIDGTGFVKTQALSLILLVIFALVIGLQLMGMIFHRLATFWHIMASTDVRQKKQGSSDEARQEKLIDRILDQGYSNTVEKSPETSDSESLAGGDVEAGIPHIRGKSLKRGQSFVGKLVKEPKKDRPLSSLDDVILPHLEKLDQFAEMGENALNEGILKGFTGKDRRSTVKLLLKSKDQNHGNTNFARRATQIRRSMRSTRRRIQSASASSEAVLRRKDTPTNGVNVAQAARKYQRNSASAVIEETMDEAYSAADNSTYGVMGADEKIYENM